MTEEASTNPKDDITSADAAETDVVDSKTEKPPANRNSLIIRAVVIIGLIYYGYTEFLVTETPPTPPPVAAKKQKVTKPADGTEEKKPEEKVADEPVADAAKKEETPPVEDITIAKKPEEIAPSLPATTEASLSDKEVDKKIDQLIEKEVDKETAKKVDQPAEKEEKVVVQIPPAPAAPMEISHEEQRERRKEVDLKDKIVVEENYIDPPSFELLGRGLVYNCKDKFWACLNKTGYIQCNKNMKWNKTNNKEIECAVVNVYNSNEDCQTVQKYNVSSSQPTPFCKQ